MTFKFHSPKFSSGTMLSAGKLAELGNNIFEGAERKSYKGMQPDELLRLANFYAQVPSLDIRDLDDDVELTVGNNTITGLDLKTITILMWQKPRTAYVDFGKVKQVHSSIYSGAVPIPLLGLKRAKSKPYSALMQHFRSKVELDGHSLERVNETKEALERAWVLDLWLGNLFASTHFLPTGEIGWKDTPGLLLLTTLNNPDWQPNAATVKYLRSAGMGNHRGHFATAWGTARVDESPDSKLIDTDICRLYNKCDTPMRLMLAQRWVWFGKHRNDDMISSFVDWDTQPKSVDAEMFAGLETREGVANNPMNLMRSKT